QQRAEPSEPDDEKLEQSEPPRDEAILREAENEQGLRQVISELPPRCRELVRMLFFEEPPRPYQEIAATLGIASGSIGFIRQRRLERLRERLGGGRFSCNSNRAGTLFPTICSRIWRASKTTQAGRDSW